MILFSPRLAIRSEAMLKMIAQTRYENDFGNSLTKVSEQLVMSPTAVLRQAKVNVAARIIPPVLPK